MKETLANEEFVIILFKIFSGGQCVYVVLVVNDVAILFPYGVSHCGRSFQACSFHAIGKPVRRGTRKMRAYAAIFCSNGW